MMGFKSLFDEFMGKYGLAVMYGENRKGATKGYALPNPNILCSKIYHMSKVFNTISSLSVNYVMLTMKSILTRQNEK